MLLVAKEKSEGALGGTVAASTWTDSGKRLMFEERSGRWGGTEQEKHKTESYSV
jgi:hypothetical protein